MNTTFSLKSMYISTPKYGICQNTARCNLGNRFSAEPLKGASIDQKNFLQSNPAKPSTYERTIQIAKVTAAVASLAAISFAAYRYLSTPTTPIHCEDLGDNFFSGIAPKCTFDDGSMYQGEWKNDLLSGQGSYTNLFGHIFSGAFKNHEFIHEGRSIELKELDQCKPEGLTDCVISLRNKDCETIDPAYSGTVDCTFDDGDEYHGDVLQGKFSGKGFYRIFDGSKYEGFFEKDYFSGNGTYTNPSGCAFSGTFKDDQFIDDGRSIKLTDLDRCV